MSCEALHRPAESGYMHFPSQLKDYRRRSLSSVGWPTIERDTTTPPTTPPPTPTPTPRTTTITTIDTEVEKIVGFHEGKKLAVVVAYVPCRKEYWYTSSDISKFRSEAQSRGFAMRNKSISDQVSVAFAKGDRAFLFPKKKQMALNEWASSGDHRGLEPFASPKYAEQRQEVRKMVWKSVFEAQRLQMTVHQVAETSMFHSRASRCFAERMGSADRLSCACDAAPVLKTRRRFSLARRRSI